MMGSFGRILRPIFDPGLAVAPPWWQVAGKTCVAAYQPKGAASLAASYVNLATPGTYDAAPGVAPTWDATNGWTFDGLTQYLTTGVIAANGYSLLVKYVDGAAGFLAGSFNGSNTRFGLGPTLTSSYSYGDATRLVSNQTIAVRGIAGNTGYLNGLLEYSPIGTWSGTGAEIYIGARKRGDISSVDQYASAQIQAIAIYSDTLTAGEVAVVSAAMAAL